MNHHVLQTVCHSQADNIDTSSRRVYLAVRHLLLSSNVWRADVLYYISGFVVKKLLESIDCPECVSALYDNSSTSIAHDFKTPKSLFNCRQYEYMMLPSDSVYKVVACVDKIARRSLCKWSSFTKKDQLAI